MEAEIELHLLSDRLKIMSVEKGAIHKLCYPIIKIAFTRKTDCKYFSFNETNDDYTIITDNMGLKGNFFKLVVLYGKIEILSMVIGL